MFKCSYLQIYQKCELGRSSKRQNDKNLLHNCKDAWHYESYFTPEAIFL